MADLPKEIRDRERGPHALRVGLRRPQLPPADELAAFCAEGAPPAVEGGDLWIRFALPGTGDMLLVVQEEELPAGGQGFDHFLAVESGSAKACFLAAYFIARRCGGVVWIRKKAQAMAASAFGDLYLEDADLEERWARATGPA